MNLKIVRMVISMDKKTIKRLLTYCKPYRFLIMLLTLLSIVSVVFTLLTPVLIGQAIDLLVGKNQVHFQALLNKLIFYWNCYFNYFFDSMDHGTNYKYNYL